MHAILWRLLSKVAYITASACVISTSGPVEHMSYNVVNELRRVWTDRQSQSC